MSIGDKIGTLTWLSWLWNFNPIVVALIVIAIDFGVGSILKSIEGRPIWKRKNYKTFIYNDTIFIPLFIGLFAYIISSAKPMHAFYTSSLWHICIITTGFTLSVITELIAVKRGRFTLSQELSPSKLYHTFIYGIIFYYCVSSLLPLFNQHLNALEILLLATSVMGFSIMCIMDFLVLRPPTDAVLEGKYSPWSWTVREQ